MNVNKSKDPDGIPIIKLTKLHLEHNHPLVSDNAEFATKYRELTSEMKGLIESYTLCDLDVPSQVCTL